MNVPAVATLQEISPRFTLTNHIPPKLSDAVGAAPEAAQRRQKASSDEKFRSSALWVNSYEPNALPSELRRLVVGC